MFETRTLYEGEKCPGCGKNSLSQKVYLYKEPRSHDELLFFVILCEECNFKKTEIMPLAPSSHAKSNKYILKIKRPKDLETKIYRASTGSIEIPEIEMVVEPGIQAEFFITNIERILLKFKESCEFLLDNSSDQETLDLLQKRIQDLDDLLAVKREFTVILEDPEGFSYILPRSDKPR
ncbi:MAG TPA: ZPR1-type zinc finger protein [Candidatus Lokiarchaeia archaeon]|nr:ZPR1-type zinc finger protein [Candidatus Lokiarchaeia archaeon]